MSAGHRDRTSPDAPLASTAVSALRVLEVVSEQPRRTLSDIARITGFTLNRTFRLLATLESEGYVARDAAKTYRPGPKVLQAGLRARRSDPLVVAADRVLQPLASATCEAVSLACRVGLDRVVVDVWAPEGWATVATPRADTVPAYWGALGYALLAFAPRGAHDQLARTPLQPVHGVTAIDRRRLGEHLDEVRRTRVWVSHDTLLGLFSIASPVLDADGEAIASVGIAGALTRLDDASEVRLRDLVREAALAVAVRLA